MDEIIHCGLMLHHMLQTATRLVRDRADAIQSRNLHYHMGKMDRDGDIPTITGKLKVDWIDFPVEDILEQFTTLKEGILRGVFRQKAVPGLVVERRKPK